MMIEYAIVFKLIWLYYIFYGLLYASSFSLIVLQPLCKTDIWNETVSGEGDGSFFMHCQPLQRVLFIHNLKCGHGNLQFLISWNDKNFDLAVNC